MSDETTHHVTVKFVGGYQFLNHFKDVEGAPPLLVDEPPPLGDGEGPNPTTVLAAAVGNCLSASLLYCLRKVRLEPEDITAEVTAHVARNEQGRLRINGIDVALKPELREMDRARFDRCERLFEDFCTVTESVRRGVPVNVTIEETSWTR